MDSGLILMVLVCILVGGFLFTKGTQGLLEEKQRAKRGAKKRKEEVATNNKTIKGK